MSDLTRMCCTYCLSRKEWPADFPSRLYARCWGCWLDHNLGRIAPNEDVLAR